MQASIYIYIYTHLKWRIMSYGLGEGEEEKKSHENNGGGLWHLQCGAVDLLLGMKMKWKGGGIYIEDLVGVKGSANWFEEFISCKIFEYFELFIFIGLEWILRYYMFRCFYTFALKFIYIISFLKDWCESWRYVFGYFYILAWLLLETQPFLDV